MTDLRMKGKSMNIVKEVDGRIIEPHPEKPRTVFRTFAGLKKNEAFLFILDHDPFHLTGFMDRLFPDQYTWTYIERGPDLYKIEIGRKKDGDPTVDIEDVIKAIFSES